MRKTSCWALIACFFVLLIVPGAWDGLLNGSPLSWYGRMVLVGVVAIALALSFFRPRRASRWALWALLGLIALKCAVGALDGPSGWMGTYALTDTRPSRVAPFFERLRLEHFRIDREVSFTRGKKFRFHFLNDVMRYNDLAYWPDRPVALPIDMLWSTWVEVPRAQRLDVMVRAESDVAVYVDRRRLDLVKEGRVWAAHAELEPPEHSLVVSYAKPARSPAAIRIDVFLGGLPAKLHPFRNRPPLGTLAVVISDGTVLLGIALLLQQLWSGFVPGPLQPRGGASRGSALAAWLACMAILIAATQSAVGFESAPLDMTASVDLSPSNDPLCYESNARNIMEEGLLMPTGYQKGKGHPYFCYPLYSYALAGVHWTVGEDQAAVRLFNGLCSATLPLLFWVIGWRRLGLVAQSAGLAALVWLVVRHSGPYWELALTDNLFIPLAIGAVGAASVATLTGHRLWAVAAGGAAALAGSTRPSFLLFVIAFVAAILAFARELTLRERLLRSGLFAAAYLAALLPFLARNYIMSGKPAMVVTLSHAITVALVPPEGGISPPPMSTYPPPWSEALWGAGQMFRAQPRLLLWLEVRKVLFTVGFTNLGPPDVGPHHDFPVLLGLCAIAFWRKRVPWHVAIAFSAFLVSHLAAVVIAYPWTYGYKTILPLQYLFLFCGLYLMSGGRLRTIGGRNENCP